MKIIQDVASKTAKLWPDGKPLQKVYRLFEYLITKDIDDGRLMLNTASGELIFLEYEDLNNVAQLPCVYAPWMNTLIQKHFLVADDSDDQNTVDLLRRSLRMLGNSRNITGYTILPTTDCNARCFYCYECGIIRESMSDATADMLVDFIDRHHGKEPVKIGWFGGEPLIGLQLIDRICKSLKERDIAFRSQMISNGYLFDEKIAKRAKVDWNLYQIQITLDGTEEIYNKTKAYLHPCKNPYQRVLDNIHRVLDNGIEVEIRLNLGLHNADDLFVLVDELVAFFEDKTNLKVYSHILFDGCGVESIHYNEDELAGLLQKQKELNEQMCRYAPASYRPSLPSLSGVHCNVDTASVVVLPSGKLGKCQHYANSHFIGDLEHGITDLREIQLLRERVTFSSCPHCPYYPVCDKLTYCEIDHSCHPLYVQYKTEETLRTMTLFYEDFVNGTQSSISSEIDK